MLSLAPRPVTVTFVIQDKWIAAQNKGTPNLACGGTAEAPLAEGWVCVACGFTDNPPSYSLCDWCGILNHAATGEPTISLQQETLTVARAVEVSLVGHRACLKEERRELAQSLGDKGSAVPEHV